MGSFGIIVNSWSPATFLGLCNFIKTEAPVQVFSCEFHKISRNIYFVEYLRTAASDWDQMVKELDIFLFN